MGCGGSIYYGIIYWPPPPPKIFKNIILYEIQLQLSFKTQNIYISQTILFRGWHFFFMGWVGGVNILWYNILTPLPLNDIKERQLQSRIQWQLCFIISTIYRSLLTQYQCRYFKLGFSGWGVKILWHNILTPLPLIDIKERQLQSRIQWQLCFIISTIYRSLLTQYQCRYFKLSFSGWGGQNIMV